MKQLLVIVAAVVFSSYAFADESGLLDRNAGIVTKASKYSVVESMDRVEAAAKSIGANIFARIDYQQMSKKVNVDIRPNQLLIFGRGAGGPYIIKEAPLAGIDIPFKALVWEDSQERSGSATPTGPSSTSAMRSKERHRMSRILTRPSRR
jgi:uncharacterized protein (DUF302 family)